MEAALISGLFLFLSHKMPVEKIHIETFLELAARHPVIDVRSPGEFNHAHLPGAHSFPLFSDEERKVVGTTYKQQSREAAIKTGLDYFGPKMRDMVEKAELIVSSRKSSLNASPNSGLSDSRTLLIYCWRGGMRSGAVSWLLDLYGFKVYTLIGGYKKFRNHVLDIFRRPFPLKILGGYTGSGKTELLNALKANGEKVVDLEALAGHKGSAFGNIGLPPQPSQEMFENKLSFELQAVSSGSLKEIWMEDESQRIGQVNIPGDLWKTMRSSPVYFLEIPFEERLKHITDEYGNLERQRMIDAVGRIREKLGGLNAKNAIGLLESGNTLESFRILLKYYDTFYLRALHNREGLHSLLQRIECKSVTPENATLLIRQPNPLPEQA